MGKWDVRRANAAVKAAEAQIAGTNFNYEQAVNKIANNEKKWNVWRVDLYKKDIEAAKASGKTREMALLQRDMERFKQRRIDEVVYREAIQTKQSNYLGVLNNVAIKSAVLSGASLQETTKALAGQSSSAAASFSIMDAKNMTQQQARTAQAAKSAARAADKTATLSTDTNALRAAGASAEQATAYEAARAAKQTARQNWNAASASGNKAAEAAAEAAFMAAREAETVAGRAAADAAAQASVAASAATAAAQEVAQEVTAAAQEAATEVAQAAQEASQDVQQAALDALWEVESAANNTFDVFRATAAIRQLQAEMNGNDFSYRGASSYEEAMEIINKGQESGMSGVEFSNKHGGDPNRIGKCGKSSC